MALMTRRRMVIIAVLGSFVGLFSLVVFMSRRSVITVQEAGLMSVALVGLYVGFGILIGVYRLINKLD